MAKIVTEHTRRQAHALRKLREQLGLTEMQVAARLWFKTVQAYQLYEQATSVIRLDQVPVWAAAFGISEREFLNAVVIGEEVAAWSPRTAMEAAGVDPERINRVEHTVADWDEADQRDVVDRAITEHGEAIAEAERHRSAS